MVHTPADRWADVTWALHRRLMTVTADAQEAARWLEACSPGAGRPCYVSHRARATQLVAGYAAALAADNTGNTGESLPIGNAQQLRASTTVVPAGRLSERVLDDLQDKA